MSKAYWINKDGSAEEISSDDMEEIETSADRWTPQGIEAEKCKNFSGKFMCPEENKDLN